MLSYYIQNIFIHSDLVLNPLYFLNLVTYPEKYTGFAGKLCVFKIREVFTFYGKTFNFNFITYTQQKTSKQRTTFFYYFLLSRFCLFLRRRSRLEVGRKEEEEEKDE